MSADLEIGKDDLYERLPDEVKLPLRGMTGGSRKEHGHIELRYGVFLLS